MLFFTVLFDHFVYFWEVMILSTYFPERKRNDYYSFVFCFTEAKEKVFIYKEKFLFFFFYLFLCDWILLKYLSEISFCYNTIREFQEGRTRDSSSIKFYYFRCFYMCLKILSRKVYVVSRSFDHLRTYITSVYCRISHNHRLYENRSQSAKWIVDSYICHSSFRRNTGISFW